MIYGNGAKMGFTPAQVRAMSLWDYLACADAFSDGTPSGGGGLTLDELHDLGLE